MVRSVTNSIDFYYFDLGNVLLRFDHNTACKNIAEVAGTDVSSVREIIFESGMELRYERGELTTLQFYDEFCRRSATQPEFEAIVSAAANIFSPIQASIDVAIAMKSAGHRIGVLSNTNEAHWHFCTKHGFPVLDQLFEVTALSYQMRALKPDPEIYHQAAHMAGVSPSKIFFVDDRHENVSAACDAGFDAVLFTTSDSLRAELKHRGVVV